MVDETGLGERQKMRMTEKKVLRFAKGGGNGELR